MSEKKKKGRGRPSAPPDRHELSADHVLTILRGMARNNQLLGALISTAMEQAGRENAEGREVELNQTVAKLQARLAKLEPEEEAKPDEPEEDDKPGEDNEDGDVEAED